MMAETPKESSSSSRSLRKRKSVDYAALEEDDEVGEGESGKQNKWVAYLKTRPFGDASVVQYYEDGAALTLEWARTSGLRRPTILRDAKHSGLSVPPKTFDVKKVVECVGAKYPLTVMKVEDQSELADEWCLGDWLRYWENDRRRTLNVISLEISKTKLAEKVRSPRLVRQIDWIDAAWPDELRARNEYPQTQYYCLMSAAGSYTDFHVDFGGTAVWYHVVRGEKVFYLVAPTDERLAAYERWICDVDQDATFFADLLEDPLATSRVTLSQGQTLFIPSAWIHAVFTPVDSLVFGGNFLPGLSTLRDQLKVHGLETRARIHRKFRFPFFTSAMFFGLSLTHRRLKNDDDPLTAAERDGLAALLDACEVWASSGDPTAQAHALLAARNADFATPAQLVAAVRQRLQALFPRATTQLDDHVGGVTQKKDAAAKLRLPAAWFDQTHQPSAAAAAEEDDDDAPARREQPPPRPKQTTTPATTTTTKKKGPTTAMGRLKAKLGGPKRAKR